MRRLFRENRVISSITAELDCKSCFEVLTDPVLSEKYFSEEERRVFQHHVLWTRVVQRAEDHPALAASAGDLLEFARREREWLVLKPSRGYGGDGVVLGQTVSDGEWVSALDAALADEELWVRPATGADPGGRGANPHGGRDAASGGVLSRDGVRVERRGDRDPRAGVAAPGGERGTARGDGGGDGGGGGGGSGGSGGGSAHGVAFLAVTALLPRCPAAPAAPASTTYASIAKYSASPSLSSSAAVPLFRASTRCQNSRSSGPGNGAVSFCDWCLKIAWILSRSSSWDSGTSQVASVTGHSCQAPR